MGGQRRLVAARDDDPRPFGPGQQRYGASDSTATADDNHTLTLQGTHS